MSKHILSILLAGLLLLLCSPSASKEVETIESLTTSRVCDRPIDLHITSTTPFSAAVSLNITHSEAWLFFDNIPPQEVVKQYSKNILINGVPLDPTLNARIAIYKQGAVIMPHAAGFEPLTTYTQPHFAGDSARYMCDRYYTNRPPANAPANLVLSLAGDNAIRSFILKRGYMATFANEASGLGYSRVFIAADSDLVLSSLPDLLDSKISFIRVSRWQYASKKGWAGSVWSAAPDGLKYVTQQCDTTHSTWYYNWGCNPDPNRTQPDYNHEFIPEKWGAGGSWSSAYSITNVAQLMGYNEPDHTEQSNVSVETALSEWPLMLSTGLRLGSPATTNYSWIYSFMSEAKRHNYRVDFVVIHAYWGGLTGIEWYEKLKEIHDRVGRPLWIKEWNNGANWTKESWPSGTEAQQAKQLSDLTSILTVMDTCSFVERYSIYNWVEDKRAIILDGKLTPAGKYYAADTPDFGYLPHEQYIPQWTVREEPLVTYHGYTPQEGLELSWSDYNGEMVPHYRVETSDDNILYTPCDTIEASAGYYHIQPLRNTSTSYLRITSLPLASCGSGKSSRAITIHTVAGEEGDKICYGELLINEYLTPTLFHNPYAQTPVVLPGIATYRNKMPLSLHIQGASPTHFDYKIDSWSYQLSPALANPDTLALLALPAGVHHFDSLTLQNSYLSITNHGWQQVTFSQPFDRLPVVIAMPAGQNEGDGYSVRVKDITPTGFMALIQYEGGVTPCDTAELVSCLASTPGTAHCNGYDIQVGTTPDSVGNSLSGGYRIDLGTSYAALPHIFACMQSFHDSITSTLRIKARDLSSFTLIKDREKSTGYTPVLPEQASWIAIGSREESAVSSLLNETPTWNRTGNLLTLTGACTPLPLHLYTSSGELVLLKKNSFSIDINPFPRGIYFLQYGNYPAIKITK